MLLERLSNNNKPEIYLNTLQKKTKKIVVDKINNGIYQLEEIDCPICFNSNKEQIGEKDRYGIKYKTNICTNCGLIYTSPRMTQTSFNEFYNLEYRKLYVGKETATSDFFYGQTIKGEKIYAFLEKNSLLKNNRMSILEIGCGSGGILEVFKKNGHKTIGIDLGEEYIKYGISNHDLNLQLGSLSELNIEEKPDIIIYSHVLEHIVDLNHELKLLKNLAHENTVFYIEVPGIKEIHKNYDSNILKYFQNAHTFHFSLESLTNLFSRNGFELIYGNQFIQSAFTFTKKSSPIKPDYNNTINYIQSIEKKRIFYPFTLNGVKSFSKRILLRITQITRIKPLLRIIRKNSIY